MKPWGIIQARMTSKRLPGKVLREAQGKPLLDYLVERILRVETIGTVLIATSVESSDDPIVEYCAKKKLLFFRGSLEDVAGRFAGAIKQFDIPAFVRINGDSPLIDPVLVSYAVTLFREKNAEIVTNVFRRSFPKGQSVEVLLSDVFTRAYSCMLPADKEHVTTFFYRFPEKFGIHSFELPGQSYSDVNLSIDTLADFQRFEELLRQSQGKAASLTWQELAEIYQRANLSAS
jgi:spore coat polysaccharide biosynthesis protein SpsF